MTMRSIPISRRDEFASDSEVSDATFATPHRVDEAGGSRGRKRKPVYSTGRVRPEAAEAAEVTQGAEWSGATTMPSMPDVFQSPRPTDNVAPTPSPAAREEEDKSPKVKVTLKRVPSSSSPSGSPASWDIKRTDGDDELETDGERQPHGAKKAAATKKLDKVVLNLKKTAGNNWNVSSSSEAETEKELQTKRRGRKSKTAPVKKIHPSKMGDAEKEGVDGDEGSNANLVMPTKEQASTPTKAILPNKEPSLPETSNSEAKKPTTLKKPAAAAAKTRTPVKTYSRKKGSSAMESSITNRLTMNTGLPVTVTILDDAPSPAVETSAIDAPIASSSTRNNFCSANDMSDFDMKEIRDMSRKIMASEEEQIPEYRSLLKAIGVGSVTEDADFVRKIQQSLKLTSGAGADAKPELTFHVGNSRAAIDLPSETLDVSSNKDKGAKVRLTAESDGIEGETMRSTFSQRLPQVVVKKGRPPKQKQLQQQQHRQQHDESEAVITAPDHAPLPPTMVQPAPSRFNAEVELQQHLPRYVEVDMWPEPFSEEELARQAGLNYELLKNGTVNSFMQNVGKLMQMYQCPPEWISGGIDPVVAMMITRRQDPAYREIDFDAMLELYSKITKFKKLEDDQKKKAEERRQRELQLQQQRDRDHQLQLQQQQQQQLQQQQQQAIDLSRAKTVPASAIDDSPRTYTELRPVRGEGSASEVLQRHHEENRRRDATVAAAETSERVAVVEPPSPDNQRNAEAEAERRPNQTPKSPMPATFRTAAGRTIKQEVMPPTPMSVQPNDSVVPTSVLPMPPSVEVVKDANRGVGVGVGDHAVNINLNDIYAFGPIRVRTEEEIQLLTSLVKEKCDASVHRGKTVHAAPQYYSMAERAKSILLPEVVKYINYAFTKKGMKEHQKGRKRNNYPKRSQIIKIDKETGEKIYPKGHPMHNDNARRIKQEPEDVIENVEPPSQTHQPARRQADLKRSSTVVAGVGPVAEKRPRSATFTLGPSQTSTPSGSDVVRSNIRSMLAKADSPAAANPETPPAVPSIDCPPSEETTSISLNDPMQESMIAHSVPSPLRVSARKRAQKTSERPTAKRASKLRSGASSRSCAQPPPPPKSSPLTVANLARHQRMTSAQQVPVDQPACSPTEGRVKSVSHAAGRVKYRGYETKGKSAAKQEDAVAKQIASSSKSLIKNIEDMMVAKGVEETESEAAKEPTKKSAAPPAPEPVTRNQRMRARAAKSPRRRIATLGPEIPASPNPSPAAAGDPAVASSTTYVRSRAKMENIKRLLERREKKKERQLAAVSEPGKYRGYAGYGTKPPSQSNEQPVVRPKFSEAEVLGGFKKVVRPDGTVVKIAVEAAKSEEAVSSAVTAEEFGGEDHSLPKKAKKLAQTSQEEQDLMAELFEIADSIEEPTASTSKSAGPMTASAGDNVAPTASTSNNIVPPASAGFETGPRLVEDWNPTFEDLF